MTMGARHSILTSSLPAADLVIARDFLFHLSTDHIHTAIAAIQESKSKLLLTTTFPWVAANSDLPPTAQAHLGFAAQPESPVWGYREVNLDIAPFGLGGAGLESVEESWGEDDDDVTSTRLLKLYAVPELASGGVGGGGGAGQLASAAPTPGAAAAAHVHVELRIIQAVPGLPVVVEWRASQPAAAGDWLALVRHDEHAEQACWRPDCLLWHAPVAAAASGGTIASNSSREGAFVLPEGGPWWLGYLAAREPEAAREHEPLASVPAQDPATLFVVTSLTGYSSRRNQFITQLLFHMEYLWLARTVLNMRIVAPTFVLNPRNHTMYEQAIRDAQAAGRALSPDFKAILGLLPVDFHEVFDESALGEYSFNAVSRQSFEESAGYVIDLLIVIDAFAIYGQACSARPRCDYYECRTESSDEGKGARSMEFYGKLFWVEHVHCVPHDTSGVALIQEMAAAIAAHRRGGGGRRVAVAAVTVNHLFAEERPRGLRELWADDPVEARHFQHVLSHLTPAPHIQQHLAAIRQTYLRDGFVAGA